MSDTAAIVNVADVPQRAYRRHKGHKGYYPGYARERRDTYHFYFYNPYYSYSPHYDYSPYPHPSRAIFLYCSSGICFGS